MCRFKHFHIITHPPTNTYAWVVTGGTINGSSTIDPISVTWGNGSTGSVEVTETDNTTHCSTTISENIVINPLPTASISGTTTVCKDATAPDITFTGAGGTALYTFTYKINNGSDQTVATTSGNSVTVSALTLAAGTYTYTLVSVQDASSTTCSQNQTGSAVITVNPLTIISSQSTATQTQCINGTFNAITVTASGTNINYHWYSNTNATTTGGIAIGTNSNSYTPLATTVGTLYYYCVVSGDCGTNQTSAVSGAFIVNPATLISSQSTAAQAHYINVPFNAITVTATGTNLTYQWFSNTTASTSGGTNLGSGDGAQTNSYTPPATTIGTSYYYCVVSGSCGANQTSAISGLFEVLPAFATTDVPILVTSVSATLTGSIKRYEWL